jgi:hypothetical protein
VLPAGGAEARHVDPAPAAAAAAAAAACVQDAATRLVAGSLGRAFSKLEEAAIVKLAADSAAAVRLATEGKYRWSRADTAVDIVGAGLRGMYSCHDDILDPEGTKQRRNAVTTARAAARAAGRPLPPFPGKSITRALQDFLVSDLVAARGCKAARGE